MKGLREKVGNPLGKAMESKPVGNGGTRIGGEKSTNTGLKMG